MRRCGVLCPEKFPKIPAYSPLQFNLFQYFFENSHFFCCQGNAFAHFCSVGRPVSYIVFGFSVAPGHQVQLSGPTTFTLTDNTKFFNNFIFEWFILDCLRFRAKFGITKNDQDDQTRLSPLHSQFDDMEDTEKGLFTQTMIRQLNYEGDVAITFGKLIAEKHMVNAVGGFNFSNNKSQNYGYSAK